MKTVPRLYTQRCTLTKIIESDLPYLHQVLFDGESIRFLPELYDVAKTADGLKQIIISFNTYLSQDEGILWGIRLDDNLIGFIAVMDLSVEPTIFYAIHSNDRRLGYMTECVHKVIDFLFERDICDYIQTEVYIDNKASLKLLFKNGFEIVDKGNEKYFLRKNNPI